MYESYMYVCKYCTCTQVQVNCFQLDSNQTIFVIVLSASHIEYLCVYMAQSV